MELNPSKTEEMCISTKKAPPIHPPLFLGNSVIQTVKHHKHIGVILTSNMSWSTHITQMVAKVFKKVSIINNLKFKLPRQILDNIYKTFIRPSLEYADVVWHSCSDSDSRLIERLQYECSLTVSGAVRGSSYSSVIQELGWEKLSERRYVHSLLLFYKIANGQARRYLTDLLPPAVSEATSYNLRNKSNIQMPVCTTNRFLRSFVPYSIHKWNCLDLVRSLSLHLFKKYLIRSVRPVVPTYFSSGSRYPCVLLTRLRVGTHSLNHSLSVRNLVDNPSCTCGRRCKSISHFLLHCPNFTNQRLLLFDRLKNLNISTLNIDALSETALIHLLIRGSPLLSSADNAGVLYVTQMYLMESKRFV